MRTSGQVKAIMGTNKNFEGQKVAVQFYLRRILIPVGSKGKKKKIKESQINVLMDGKIIYVVRGILKYGNTQIANNDKYKLHEGKLYKQVENDWYQYSVETKDIMMDRKIQDE